jgi:SOS-response transcriptional repressor LexA
MPQPQKCELSHRALSFLGCDTSFMARSTATEPSRRYQLLSSLRPEGLTEAEWTRRAKVSSSWFQDLKRGAVPRVDTLERVLDVIAISPAEFETMDAPVLSEVRAGGARGFSDVHRQFYGERPLPDLPLYGSAVGGEYGDIDEHIELTELHLHEVLDYLARPAKLAKDPDAYSLTIVGDSMAPRFKPGERVAVSPKASIGIGDDVIVQLRSTQSDDERIRMVLVKELVRRGAGYVELKQHNPAVTFRIEWHRVAAMHKVMGHYF